jgi:hypothetical protein
LVFDEGTESADIATNGNILLLDKFCRLGRVPNLRKMKNWKYKKEKEKKEGIFYLVTSKRHKIS